MNLFIAVCVSIVFACGFFLLVQRGLLNRALGLLVISHGANFVLMTSAGLKSRVDPPLLQAASSSYADPLPQALILTALVIGFGVAAFLWALVLRLRKEE